MEKLRVVCLHTLHTSYAQTIGYEHERLQTSNLHPF